MKRLLAILLTTVLVFSVISMDAFVLNVKAATSGTTGDCTWTLIDGVLTITGNGAMLDYSNSNPAPYLKYKFDKVVLAEGVTRIGECAFSGCSSLISVEIPSSVTHIGDNAFYYCYDLEDVYIYDLSKWCQIDFTGIDSQPIQHARKLYLNDELITELIIPEGVTSIGNYAFYFCFSMTSVEIPNSVTSIGSSAFYGCRGLTSVEIPNSVTSIESSAFAGCSGLTSVEIPNSVTSIGSAAFSSCEGLTSVEIPNSVTSIENSAFRKCSSLTSVEIPNSVTSIGDSAFQYCRSLISVEIPSSVTHIGDDAFHQCDALEEVYIHDLSKWCQINFDGTFSHPMCSNASKLYLNDELITELIIPEGVTSIVNYAFDNCISLTSVKIPNSVTSIGGSAFYNCRSLTNIEIPNSVTSIGWSAFSGCSGLTSVEIPGSVTRIGRSAFKGCSSLTSVKIPDGVTSIGEDAFYNCSSLTSVEIPSSITSVVDGGVIVGNSPFWGCTALEEIYIHDVSQWCKLNFAGGWFRSLSSPPMKLYLNGELITELVIPKGVTSIVNYAFYNCSSLTSVEIPSSVSSIESSAFSGCSGLSDVWYHGSQEEKSNMHVGNGNDRIMSATWHYNTCSFNEHIYLHACDSTCENCDWVRITTNTVSDEHDFTLNNDLTCQYCGYSKQPNKPIIESKSENIISLVANDIYEYSKDGENWQLSNVFDGLLAGNTYTFYQRVKANEFTLVSEKSASLIVKTDKGTQLPPTQPTLISKTYDTVTLTLFSGYEYSVDGINWQTSNVFVGLNPNTDYLFYQRKMETDTHYASPMSSSLEVRTNENPTYKVGDLDEDSELTDWDGVMLARYLAGWQVDVATLEALDIDNDGEITDWDGVILDRYLAGWNVSVFVGNKIAVEL